jgi:hypothetical protein
LNKIWDRFFLNEEDNKFARFNKAAIGKMHDEDAYDAIYNSHVIRANFHKITPLHEAYIAKKLGRGAFGIAMLLSNDHVFKIFKLWDGGGGEESHDWKIYSKMYQQSGQGTTSSLVVYDMGWIVEDKLAFIETNRVYTIREYFDMTGRALGQRLPPIGYVSEIIKWMLQRADKPELTKPESVAKKIVNYVFNGGKGKDDFRNSMLVHITNLKTQYKWTIEEINSLITTLVEFSQEHGVEAYDIHSNNLGVATYTPGGSGVKFVIFDF